MLGRLLAGQARLPDQARDIVEIERADGKRFMVPMTAQAVPEWDGERLVISEGFAD